jgi:hypothetical protein
MHRYANTKIYLDTKCLICPYLISNRHMSFLLALAGHTTYIDFKLSDTQCAYCVAAVTTKRSSCVPVVEENSEQSE